MTPKRELTRTILHHTSCFLHPRSSRTSLTEIWPALVVTWRARCGRGVNLSRARHPGWPEEWSRRTPCRARRRLCLCFATETDGARARFGTAAFVSAGEHAAGDIGDRCLKMYPFCRVSWGCHAGNGDIRSGWPSSSAFSQRPSGVPIARLPFVIFSKWFSNSHNTDVTLHIFSSAPTYIISQNKAAWIISLNPTFWWGANLAYVT